MGAGSAASWTRFYDQVVVSEAWPRPLWALAVGDALADHLPGSSSLVAEFRRDAAEFMAIGQSGPRTYREERRVAELTDRLRDLVNQADGEIRAKSEAGRGPVRQLRPGRQRADSARMPGGLGAAALGTAAAVAGGVFVAGVGATLYFYDLRLGKRIEPVLQPHLEEVRGLISDAEQRLDSRIGEAGAERATAAAILREVETEAASLRKKMAASLDTMAEIQAAAPTVGAGESQASEVEQALARMKQRGDALGRALDDVSVDLASLEARLPEARQSLTRLDEQIGSGREGYDATAAEVATLRARIAEFDALAAREQKAMEAQLAAQQRALDVLDEQIAALEGAIGSSKARIDELDQTMQDAVAIAESRLGLLRTAADEVEATRARISTVVGQTEDNAERLETDVADRLDTILGETADKADLAVLRSEGTLRRAETQALRQIDAGREEAVRSLGDARTDQLAGLASEIEATRVEIAQTRAGLIASWQRMDALVAERYDELLAEIDDYAAAIAANVQRLDEAGAGVELQRASSGGPP